LSEITVLFINAGGLTRRSHATHNDFLDFQVNNN